MARPKTQKKRYKGGDNERIYKLKKIIINIFYYCANKLYLKIPKDVTLMQLVNKIQSYSREYGKAYQLFPPNFLTNEYMSQIDTQLKNISDKINALVVNDPLEFDDFEYEHIELSNEIFNLLYSKLYVNFIVDINNVNSKDIEFYYNLIEPELNKIYNIKEVYDESYLKFTEEEYEAKKNMIIQRNEENKKNALNLLTHTKI